MIYFQKSFRFQLGMEQNFIVRLSIKGGGRWGVCNDCRTGVVRWWANFRAQGAYRIYIATFLIVFALFVSNIKFATPSF